MKKKIAVNIFQGLTLVMLIFHMTSTGLKTDKPTQEIESPRVTFEKKKNEIFWKRT